MEKKESLGSHKRRLYGNSLLNTDPEFHNLRQFLSEVEKIRKLSKTPKRSEPHPTPQRLLSIKNARISSNLLTRKPNRPLPQLTFKQVHNTSSRSCSRPKKQIQRSPNHGNTISNNANDATLEATDNSSEMINYYRRVLLPVERRIAMEPSDVYLTISKIKIPQIWASKASKAFKTKTDGSRSGRRGSYTPHRPKKSSQQPQFFGKYDTPWDHHRSMTYDQ